MSATALLLCAVIGFVAGVLNVFAAGGSFMTLPLLLFLGLPASVANGTNRVGVLAQNISGVWGFHRHGVMEWRWALGASTISAVGAVLGVWIALAVPDFAFRRILSVAMLVITLGTLWQSRRAEYSAGPPRVGPFHWTMTVGFFVVGVYSGFLQAGVGFLVLGLTTLARMDLVRGNAIKMVNVLIVTVVSLAIFAGTGHIDWPLGLALGVGNFLGGLVGVRVAVLHGHRWIEQVVTIAIIVFAVLLWLTE